MKLVERSKRLEHQEHAERAEQAECAEHAECLKHRGVQWSAAERGGAPRRAMEPVKNVKYVE